jgi:hypothetical protein
MDVFGEILDLPVQVKNEPRSPERTVPLVKIENIVKMNVESNQEVNDNIKIENKEEQNAPSYQTSYEHSYQTSYQTSYQPFETDKTAKTRKDPRTLKCEVCGSKFFTNVRLQKHIVEVHKKGRKGQDRSGEPRNPNWKRRVGKEIFQHLS